MVPVGRYLQNKFSFEGTPLSGAMLVGGRVIQLRLAPEQAVLNFGFPQRPLYKAWLGSLNSHGFVFVETPFKDGRTPFPILLMSTS